MLLLATIAVTAIGFGTVTTAQAHASKGNVLVIARTDSFNEGPEAAALLRSLHYTATLSATVPPELSHYSSVWYVSGEQAISGPEQEVFEQYVNQGGKLYLSGGPCCEALNESDTAIARALLNNKEIYVGRDVPYYDPGNPDATLYFNPQAADGVTQTPNALGAYPSAMVGGHSGIGEISARNVLAGDDATAVAAVFDESDMEYGRGRLAIYPENFWWLGFAALTPQRAAVIQNIADFLERTPTRLAPRSAEYVALGDSYASGVGSFSYLPESNEKANCDRATDGYAEQIATKNNLSLGFAACSGSEIGDLMEGNKAQLKEVGADTNLVTLSIGGNDVGFKPVLQSCSIGPLTGGGAGCAARDSAAAATALEWLQYGRPPGRYRLPGTSPKVKSVIGSVLHAVRVREWSKNAQPQPNLLELYEAISAQAPHAQIVVVGYPKLFESGQREVDDCQVGTLLYGTDKVYLAASDIRWLNEQTDRVDEQIKEAVYELREWGDRLGHRGTRIVFADPRKAFTGHGLCDSGASYINPLLSEGLPKSESFHPTVEGQNVLDGVIEAARIEH